MTSDSDHSSKEPDFADMLGAPALDPALFGALVNRALGSSPSEADPHLIPELRLSPLDDDAPAPDGDDRVSEGEHIDPDDDLLEDTTETGDDTGLGHDAELTHLETPTTEIPDHPTDISGDIGDIDGSAYDAGPGHV